MSNIRNQFSNGIVLEEYSGYFHDGIVFEIEHVENEVIFHLESCGLYPESNVDNIPLSPRNTIVGKLHLKQITSILINGKEWKEELKVLYDEGDIYHLKIEQSKFLLQVGWIDYSIQPNKEMGFSTIEIEAKEIYWENIPNLFDASWEEENG